MSALGPVPEMTSKDDMQRARILRALGVTAYRLRTHAVDETSPLPDEIPMVTAVAGAVALVTLLPAQADARHLDLVGHALQSFGAHFARAPRIRVASGRAMQAIPPAHIYLVFGRDQAQALGREVPAAQVDAAQVLLVDAPEQLQCANGKRELWRALKRARRALAAAAAAGQVQG